MVATFIITPEFSYKTTANFQTLQTPFESGAVQLRARWPRPKRAWSLNWKHATPAQAEQLRAFFRDHSGPADTFYYSPVDKIARPYIAPTVSFSSGGTLGTRTRHAKYTWADSSDNETQQSVDSDYKDLVNGQLFTVTPPAFPNNVTKAWIYVGATAANVLRQATAVTTSGSTWTEPSGGYADDGAAVPTTNALSETVTAHFAADSLDIVKLKAYNYSMQVVIEEYLVA